MEYANLRSVFTYSYAGEVRTGLFVRWYQRSNYPSATKCTMVCSRPSIRPSDVVSNIPLFQLSVQKMDDPMTSGVLCPFYDVISARDISDIVCVRPNNMPRADAPECCFFLNRFILEF